MLTAALLSLSLSASAAKRPVTYVVDTNLSEGPIENFRELYVDPYQVTALLSPLTDVTRLRPQARVVDDQIHINDRIFFAPNSANIRPSSHLILDAVADTMNRRADIESVSIHGHMSATTSADRNLALSVRRTKAIVDYLTSKGVHPKRLTSIGFGDSRSVGTSERGVEFVIERWNRDRQPDDPETATPVEAGAGRASLLIENSHSFTATVAINGTPIGVIGPYTDGAIHGLKAGLYDISFTHPTGFSMFKAVRTSTVQSPIVPGGNPARTSLANQGYPVSETPSGS